ncbi:MAG: helix-turn-helix domain-containing protein [Candidatus Diapherotrites archaeon]|uniref:Putative HTH-type transcriptional regulatory protein FJY86_02840 n=1 Tax=Candidatus Iainarchaeum sp. TaxID=3101447 RepID=A0A8T4C8H4_9ARCH|nr:helix-turn-helix domain-containing protein [Candidatus Diapherotrites archaeon]
MIRPTLLERVLQLLREYGFTYQSFFDSNSSFDIIARQQNIVLILKVLSNIDSLRAEHARDLQKLTHSFNAHSLVIGEKTKVFELQNNVLYERYGLPVLSLKGFELLLQQRMPAQRSFKGKNIVELDVNTLRKEREARDLTLKELSERAGISLESLHRYEHGSPAQLDVAEKLEEILHAKLIRGINVFEHCYPLVERAEQNPLSINALDQLRELGLKLSVFERAPLTAAAEDEHRLLISHVEDTHHAAKKAMQLEKTQHVVKQPGIIVTRSRKNLHVNNVPILREEEISTFSNVKDMLKTMNERRESRKKEKK